MTFDNRLPPAVNTLKRYSRPEFQRKKSPAPVFSEFLTDPQKIYRYLGPSQSAGLFAAGFASAFALRAFLKVFRLPDLKKQLTDHPLSKLAQQTKARLAEGEAGKSNTQLVLSSSGDDLISNLMLGLTFEPLRDRVLAHLSASILGYGLGSIANGFKEILVRKEETQIRADLLNRLTGSFRQSIQTKTAVDNDIREKAKWRIQDILTRCNVPFPEQLLKASPDTPLDKQLQQYPYIPTDLSKPFTSGTEMRFSASAAQSSVSSLQKAGTPLHNPALTNTLRPYDLNDPWPMKAVKASIFGLGLATGSLSQLIFHFTKAPTVKPLLEPHKAELVQWFSTTNKQALFLAANKYFIAGVLGLVAVGRVAKMMVDSYLEIEVTRQNAGTEARYQDYIWLYKDPSLHRIAEEEALEDALKKLVDALPFEYNNRPALIKRIQTIFENIGRNSPPKYFQMMLPMNLVEARG